MSEKAKLRIAFGLYVLLLVVAAITLHMWTLDSPFKRTDTPAEKHFVCTDWQVYEMKRVPDGLVLGGFQTCVYGELQDTPDGDR